MCGPDQNKVDKKVLNKIKLQEFYELKQKSNIEMSQNKH